MCKSPMPPTTKAKAPPRRAMHILRYASCKDYAMYAGAFVTVMISGANQPAQLIIFGNLLDSFNNSNTAEAVRLVHFFAMLYAIVAVQQLITITTQTALATRVAAAQARRCREKYFAAILSRPIAWFDQSDQGAVGADGRSTPCTERGGATGPPRWPPRPRRSRHLPRQQARRRRRLEGQNEMRAYLKGQMDGKKEQDQRAAKHKQAEEETVVQQTVQRMAAREDNRR